MIAMSVDQAKLKRSVGRQKREWRSLNARQIEILDEVDRRAIMRLQDQVKRRYSGRDLKVRSNLLRSSVTVTRRHVRDFVAWVVGTPVKYAEVQEEGTKTPIKAKGVPRRIVMGRRADGSMIMGMSKGKKLLIPSDEVKTAAGVGRQKNTDLVAQVLSGGQPYTTFVTEGHADNPSLMMSTADGTLTRLGTLVDSVSIKGTRTWRRLTLVLYRRLARDYQRAMAREIRRRR